MVSLMPHELDGTAVSIKRLRQGANDGDADPGATLGPRHEF